MPVIVVRNSRGQATIETVVAVILLCLVCFGLLQVARLYTSQMIAHHTAFVMARSYVVGFNERIVQRAREVGSIGLSGDLEQPAVYANLSPARLGAIEPDLIEEFVSSPNYTLWYQYWDRVGSTVPVMGLEGLSDFQVRVHDYPLEMPMHRAYMNADSVNFGSQATLYNHAGYYLY